MVDSFDSSALAPVRPTIALPRRPRCPGTPGDRLPLRRHWLCSRRKRTPECPSGTPCHTERRNESQAIPSLSRVTPSATSEYFLELLGSSPIFLPSLLPCVNLQLRLLPSPGITRLHRYYEPPRHPKRPGLALASCQLILNRQDHPMGLPVLPLIPSAYMPSPLPRQDQWNPFARTVPLDYGLPLKNGGSAPALVVSRPAQRLLGLWPARSPSRHRDPLHRRLQRLRCLRRCFDCYRVERTSSRAALSPAVDQRLFTAHSLRQLTLNFWVACDPTGIRAQPIKVVRHIACSRETSETACSRLQSPPCEPTLIVALR